MDSPSEKISFTGIDFSPVFVDQAKRNLGEKNVLQGDVCDLPDTLPRDFDLIWCVEVIEHVKEPSKLLRNAAEHLVDGGRFVLTFPQARFTGKNPEWKNIDRHLWCFEKTGILQLTEPFFIFEKVYQNIFWVFRKKQIHE